MLVIALHTDIFTTTHRSLRISCLRDAQPGVTGTTLQITLHLHHLQDSHCYLHHYSPTSSSHPKNPAARAKRHVSDPSLSPRTYCSSQVWPFCKSPTISCSCRNPFAKALHMSQEEASPFIFHSIYNCLSCDQFQYTFWLLFAFLFPPNSFYTSRMPQMSINLPITARKNCSVLVISETKIERHSKFRQGD